MSLVWNDLLVLV